MDAVAINEMENSSANSHNGVSEHHQKRGICAVLAEVQATGTGEPAAKRQSMMQANLLISNMTPGKKLPRGNPQKAVTIREEEKANNGDETEQNKQTLNITAKQK